MDFRIEGRAYGKKGEKVMKWEGGRKKGRERVGNREALQTTCY